MEHPFASTAFRRGAESLRLSYRADINPLSQTLQEDMRPRQRSRHGEKEIKKKKIAVRRLLLLLLLLRLLPLL
jgi:hypothetical protein